MASLLAVLTCYADSLLKAMPPGPAGLAGRQLQSLVDDVRRGLAFTYLFHAGTSLAEIAHILHFSDATAFHRAFKRWTGVAPARY